jgi:hypothetical protein
MLAGQNMKRILVVLVVVVLMPGLALACGKERWPVKTATDKDAAKVNESPTPGTINQLSLACRKLVFRHREDGRFVRHLLHPAQRFARAGTAE